MGQVSVTAQKTNENAARCSRTWSPKGVPDANDSALFPFDGTLARTSLGLKCIAFDFERDSMQSGFGVGGFGVLTLCLRRHSIQVSNRIPCKVPHGPAQTGKSSARAQKFRFLEYQKCSKESEACK